MVSAGVYLVEQDVSAYTQTTSSLRPGIAIRGSWGPYNEVTAITSVKDLFEIFGQPSSGVYVGLITAKKYLTYNNIIQVVRVESVVTPDVAATKTFKDASVADTLKITAKYKGSTGNSVSVTLSSTTLTVYFRGVLKEVYTVAKGSVSDKNLTYKTAINGISNYIVISDDATCDANSAAPASVTTIALESGADTLPTSGELIGASVAAGLTMFSSDNVSINLLLCPDGASLAAESVAAVGLGLTTIAEARKDVVALVDIPKGLTVAAAIAFKTTTAAYSSTYSACYWSWVEVFEASIDNTVDLPGSSIGLIGITKSDAVAYPWFAAAGFSRGGVTEGTNVEYNPDQGSRDLLSDAQINPIIFKSGSGVVLFGNQTTSSASTALQSLNVRRLLLSAKAAIKSIANSLLFEQNDENTRSIFTDRANSILNDIASKRGLYDFRVICDSSNNTADIVAQKKMVGFIKLKPTLAAEELVISFQVLSTGAAFAD